MVNGNSSVLIPPLGEKTRKIIREINNLGRKNKQTEDVEVCSLFQSRRSFSDLLRQFAYPLPMISVVDQSLPPEIQQLFLTLCPDAGIIPLPALPRVIFYVFL